jgi:sec-independent protein translocase protein TatB
MFGIGMPEMIMILVVALIVIGPKKLPDIAKGLGRAFNEFKKATTDFKESMGIDDELDDVKQAFDEMNKDIKETIDIKPSFSKEALSPSDDTHTKKELKKEPEKIDTDKSTDAD